MATDKTQYLAMVRQEPFLVGYWRQNEDAAETQMQDFAARYGLVGVFNTPRTAGPSLILGDSTAGSSSLRAGASGQVGDAAPLRLTTAFSLEAWVAPYTANQTATIIGKRIGSIAAPYAMRLAGGVVQFAVGNGTTEQTAIAPNALPLTIPSHIVTTFFRNLMTIQINGVTVTTALNTAPTVIDGAQPVTIGNGFSGLIAEAAIYSSGLSALRVSRHFNVGQQIWPDPAHYRLVDPPVMR